MRSSSCVPFRLAAPAIALAALVAAAPALAGGFLVEPSANPDLVLFDIPPAEVEARLGVSAAEMQERIARARETMQPPVRTPAMPGQGLFRGAPSDTGVALVMLCQWVDDPANTLAHPPAAYNTLLFSQGQVPTGSMREFFLETSYGFYWIEGQVTGWFTQPTYDPGAYFTDFFAAADPVIDYSQFDRDGDGYTDAVWIFHAGPGQEETHDPDHIWSFAVWGLDYMTDDGVIIDRFACNPEMHADGSIISIRVGAHEASHVLGLPDLYDYDDKLVTSTYYTPGDSNDHPLVDWCVMGYYGYNIWSYGTRQDPSHHCAWAKKELGFVAPVPITASTKDVAVPEVELNPVVYEVRRGTSQERFLIENRNTASAATFDHLDSDFSAYYTWFTPGQNPKDPGLLILHVDDSLSNNTAGPNGPHYMVAVEDAGYDPASPWDGVDEFSDWWYPQETRSSAAFAADDPGQTSFTPATTPSSAWYGSASGIWITNISEPGPLMTFDIGFGNAWPAITSHVPAELDTTLAAPSVLALSATVLDEDGDPTTYEWYENGGLVQSGPAASWEFTADTPGAVDEILLVATDGALADSVQWTLRTQEATGVPAGSLALTPTLAASPTPFRAAVQVTWALPRAGQACVSVYDLSGRRIAVLFEGRHEGATMGRTWDGRDDDGREVAAGVYFVRLETAGILESRKIVLLR
jgi:immune inhibitor A